MPADQALRVAGTRLPLLDLGQWGVAAAAPPGQRRAASELTSDLSIAAHLGKLEEEARFQQDAAVDAFLTALARCRRQARIVLTGMYLPIFHLGSAI
jgi:hypothetical protein